MLWISPTYSLCLYSTTLISLSTKPYLSCHLLVKNCQQRSILLPLRRINLPQNSNCPFLLASKRAINSDTFTFRYIYLEEMYEILNSLRPNNYFSLVDQSFLSPYRFSFRLGNSESNVFYFRHYFLAMPLEVARIEL